MKDVIINARENYKGTERKLMAAIAAEFPKARVWSQGAPRTESVFDIKTDDGAKVYSALDHGNVVPRVEELVKSLKPMLCA